MWWNVEQQLPTSWHTKCNRDVTITEQTSNLSPHSRIRTRILVVGLWILWVSRRSGDQGVHVHSGSGSPPSKQKKNNITLRTLDLEGCDNIRFLCKCGVIFLYVLDYIYVNHWWTIFNIGSERFCCSIRGKHKPLSITELFWVLYPRNEKLGNNIKEQFTVRDYS
jgi:hypothetical protein